ncbi:MAG: hypothetical protein QF701_14640 [Nitrospinota bacterium]|jgi:hypothetical protein|nr:hypothetical protein [Nitrospinota bacterium]MDP7168970.1 hypothetical protein [Nitrospinota bacterium]MDP7503229.1 hypothetical protein [Nitrospinota bacterium]MDP7662060.1 hypothetical protein [Nitrospinota bacterium]HJP14201.1 hypothetical protein [Nitrospinota bacterium]
MKNEPTRRAWLRGGAKSRLRLAALALLAAAASGFTGNLTSGLFHLTEVTSYLHLPARITKFRSVSPIYGSDSNIAAVILNYPGQTLRIESNNLIAGNTKTETLFNITDGNPEAHEFLFYEIRNIDGKTVGYLLARDDWIEFVSLGKDGSCSYRPRTRRALAPAGCILTGEAVTAPERRDHAAHG